MDYFTPLKLYPKKHYVKYMKYAYKNQEARKFVKKVSTNRKTLKNYKT